MEIGIFIGIAIVAFLGLKWFRQTERKQLLNQPMSAAQRSVLLKKVSFYNALSKSERKRFEYKVQEFLLDCEITGVDVEVDTTDKILVAAGAIIPVFAFPKWRYTNLSEVLLYPGSFNEDYETGTKDGNILGMVGNRHMEGMMILSKPALHHGFSNDKDKKNTAIHEFVHLIDKLDGNIDGIPSLLLERPYVLPWLELIDRKIDAIYDQQSDINPYGATNPVEFYAVASEYFFERPRLLAKKHPKLYHLLEEIFDQDMDARKVQKTAGPPGRNSPCMCGSGRKYKHCCGKL